MEKMTKKDFAAKKGKLAEKYEEEIVKDVTEDFKRRQLSRRSLELQWRLNMNFLIGNQYAEITALGDIDDYGKDYFWQEREVYNHIAPIIETRIAKLGRVKANMSVRPFSSDENDVNTAKLSTSVLRSISEDNRMSDIMSDANLWSEVCGSAFYKVVWNSSKGMIIGENKKGEKIAEGDVEIALCPPYEIYPDAMASANVEDARSIIHAKAYHVDDIFDTWGVRVEGGDVDIFTMDSVFVTGGLGSSGASQSVMTEKARDHAVVIERYVKSSKTYPNGRLSVVAGDKLLYDGDLPYVNGKDGSRLFPFVRQCAITNVGSFFGSSIIERLIPLQREYNAVRNRKHEFLNRIAMGVLAVEDGSVDTDNLEEEGLSPGKVLIYRQGSAPPRFMNPGSVPSDFTLEEDRLLEEFKTVSGVSDFMSSSKVPANVTSGVALSLIQEQDDTRISLTSDSLRSAVRTIGEMILRLYKEYATNKRLVRIAGENGDIELRYFNASELKCDDLVFDTDNEISDTPANRKNIVYDIIKMGLLYDGDGKMSTYSRLKVLEMLGFGNWESSADIAELHKKKAMRENDSFDFDIVEVDDHGLHIKEHTKALISGKCKRREELLEHIRMHETYTAMDGNTEANI